MKVSSGFDVISRTIESLISVQSNNQSLIYVKKSLELLSSNYLNFIKKSNTDNEKLMSLAAMYFKTYGTQKQHSKNICSCRSNRIVIEPI